MDATMGTVSSLAILSVLMCSFLSLLSALLLAWVASGMCKSIMRVRLLGAMMLLALSRADQATVASQLPECTPTCTIMLTPAGCCRLPTEPAAMCFLGISTAPCAIVMHFCMFSVTSIPIMGVSSIQALTCQTNTIKSPTLLSTRHLYRSGSLRSINSSIRPVDPRPFSCAKRDDLAASSAAPVLRRLQPSC